MVYTQEAGQELARQNPESQEEVEQIIMDFIQKEKQEKINKVLESDNEALSEAKLNKEIEIVDNEIEEIAAKIQE